MRTAKHLDVTTMFTYSHVNTPLGQSECAYYLSYFYNSRLEDSTRCLSHGILSRQLVYFILFYCGRFEIFTFRYVVLRWTKRERSNLVAFAEWVFQGLIQSLVRSPAECFFHIGFSLTGFFWLLFWKLFFCHKLPRNSVLPDTYP